MHWDRRQMSCWTQAFNYAKECLFNLHNIIWIFKLSESSDENPRWWETLQLIPLHKIICLAELFSEFILVRSCCQCIKLFSQSSSLKIHLKFTLVRNSTVAFYVQSQLAISGVLRHHMKVHTGEKAYSCSECTQSCGMPSDLKRHLRVHTGAKPYSCFQYTKSFAHSSVLQRHLRAHTGSKLYSCSQCMKFFCMSDACWLAANLSAALNVESQVT